METRARPRLTIIAGLAVAFWAVTLLAIAQLRFGGDLRGLLFLGTDFPHPSSFAAIPRYGNQGYDGQFYATIATDPLLASPGTEEALDSPSYRVSHILIPLAAWLLSLGQAGAAITVYQLLCWVLGLAGVVLVAAWLHREGHSPWWSLLLIPNAGLATSMLRSTPDAAAVALLLAALFLYRRGRHVPALIALLLATLARETSILAAPALAYLELRARRKGNALRYLLVPLAVLIVWELLANLVTSSPALLGGSVDLPFRWVPAKLNQMMAASIKITSIELWGFLTLIASLFSISAFKKQEPAEGMEEIVFLLFLALSFALSFAVYVDAYGYTRALMVLPFLALVIGLRQEDPLRRWTLLAVPCLYALLGALMVRAELKAALIASRG